MPGTYYLILTSNKLFSAFYRLPGGEEVGEGERVASLTCGTSRTADGGGCWVPWHTADPPVIVVVSRRCWISRCPRGTSSTQTLPPFPSSCLQRDLRKRIIIIIWLHISSCGREEGGGRREEGGGRREEGGGRREEGGGRREEGEEGGGRREEGGWMGRS